MLESQGGRLRKKHQRALPADGLGGKHIHHEAAAKTTEKPPKRNVSRVVGRTVGASVTPFHKRRRFFVGRQPIGAFASVLSRCGHRRRFGRNSRARRPLAKVENSRADPVAPLSPRLAVVFDVAVAHKPLSSCFFRLLG